MRGDDEMFVVLALSSEDVVVVGLVFKKETRWRIVRSAIDIDILAVFVEICWLKP